MKKITKLQDPLIKIIFNSFTDLPTPRNINLTWNFGSILGIILAIQISTGMFLSFHYCGRVEIAFSSVIHISRDVSSGWLLRYFHINGASIFFLVVLSHLSRGIINNSFKLTKVWNSGVSLLLILMGTAFLGYVLPWGQMSFWGATVITNLTSRIPYLGKDIVQWLWGGFSINNATLNRFFSFHFILPILIASIVIVHLISLHRSGSSNPSNRNSNIDKRNFHPIFTFKDIIRWVILTWTIFFLSTLTPNILVDTENYNLANPLRTPPHIQPEWYFLFAYAILRRIPNKLGGVIALLARILTLYLLPLKTSKISNSKFNFKNKVWFFFLFTTFSILTYIGANVVEPPFETIGKIFSGLYFCCLVSL